MTILETSKVYFYDRRSPRENRRSKSAASDQPQQLGSWRAKYAKHLKSTELCREIDTPNALHTRRMRNELVEANLPGTYRRERREKRATNRVRICGAEQSIDDKTITQRLQVVQIVCCQP
jgi:hypothetical protein